MWHEYGEVKKKFYPGIDNVKSVKEAFELTSVLGDRVYLIDAVAGIEYSYERSNKEANLVANALISIGLEKGARVGFLMDNSPRCVFTIVGIYKAGMIAVPINSNFREKEIEHLVNTAGISTIVVGSNLHHFDILANVSSSNEILETILIYGFEDAELKTKAKLLRMEELLGNMSDANPKVAVDDADTCAVFFTSGTTGLPKGAPITNRIFLLAAQSTLAIPWIDDKARNYTTLPLFHANAQLYSMMAMRCIGASLILSDRFSPKKFFEEMNRYHATYFNSIGGMMQILYAAFENTPVPKHSAKFVNVGGTPFDLWQRFEKKFSVSIIEGYSQSESPVAFLNADPDPSNRKVGSFGIPVFSDLGRKTKIVLDKGQDAPEKEDVTGELLQIGFNMKGYWGEEEKTKEVFTDGWLRSGDVVRRDADGYHYFVDRLKFMVRKGGENIATAEIEAVINTYPAVSESSVVPAPDALREEEIKAFIKPVEGEKIDIFGLIQHCARKLSYFKVPRYVEIVNSFDKTGTERIQKMQLKEAEKRRTDHGWDRDREIPDWKERYFGK
jgi:acyl-CoA synthetase (AMP-forming)/AMP-acid ligase II